ncbi:MAG TPA: GGDEF domain-containing protein, partial [Bacillales bacterium]
DLSKDHMAERLIEVRGMMRWAAGEEETVNQYKLLYEITKKFYSSMDVNGVLREIVLALNDFYPSFDCRLLLSYENGNEEDLPVEYLDYGKNTDNPAASKAFLTGDIQFDVINNRRAVLYAPLRGRQGVYGVLQVKVPDMPAVPDPDIELIKLLAGTGGNALENAQLYQQSQRFIADLQLINKTSHQLNSNLRLSDTIHFMAEQIVGSFGSEEVGFVLFRPFAELEILKGSTPFFHGIESRRFLNEAACRLKENQEALFISDLLDQEMVEGAPFRSFMCIPMIQNGELQGMVIALHRNPYEFSFESFKL